jgi:hypothetical protein
LRLIKEDRTLKSLPVDEKWVFGAVSLEQTEAGLKPWRIPVAEYPLFESHPNCKFESLQTSVSESAGVRLQCRTDSTRLTLQVGLNQTDSDVLYDLTIDNELQQTARCAPGADTASFDALPPGDKDVCIWLPANHAVTLVSLAVDDEASVSSVADNRLKWIAHGSSITHCRGAFSPARTWPAIAARERNLNLTSLGFGAGCHLDQHTARIIRDAEADFISLKIGINIVIVGSLGWRTFRQAVTGFIKTIREGHETTPIAVLSPIIAPNFETTKNCVNMSLQDMREELRDAVERYKRVYMDENLYFFDGITLLPEEDIASLDGFLHPDGREYEIMGYNFADQVIDNMEICKKRGQTIS